MTDSGGTAATGRTQPNSHSPLIKYLRHLPCLKLVFLQFKFKIKAQDSLCNIGIFNGALKICSKKFVNISLFNGYYNKNHGTHPITQCDLVQIPLEL